MFSFLFPRVAYAADITSLMSKVNRVIINPIILLLFGVALLVFLWGIVEFLSSPDNEQTKQEGKRHMLWGILGMAIMIGAFGIMQLIIATFGFTTPTGAIILPQAK